MTSDRKLKWTILTRQAHFHWCAEHHIEGRQPPLEVHFVHMDSKFADLVTPRPLSRRSFISSPLWTP